MRRPEESESSTPVLAGRPMPDRVWKAAGERGMALAIAVLVLLVLSLFAAAMMTSVNTETKVAGNNLRSSQALNVAEAGAAEASSRICSGDVPDSENPRMVTQIFLTEPGSVPVMGTDTTAIATSQPTGSWLRYSTAGRDPSALTVTYKTDAARSVIYRYDPSLNPAIQTTSGTPIYVITSTGRIGTDRRTIVAEVVTRPIQPNLLGSMSTRASSVKLWCGAATHGPFIYNGMNHRANTPIGDGVTGPDPENYVGWGDVSAFWCTTSIQWGGNVAFVCCTPIGAVLQNQPASSFYPGPWAALSLKQADFYTMAGTPRKALPTTFKGITFLDNDLISQNGTGKWTLSGASGEGLLYVDGDLTISGDVYWRGLIYTEGELIINGNIWVLGGVVVADKTRCAVQHIQATFLYSADTIAQTIALGTQGIYNLSWHESP